MAVTARYCGTCGGRYGDEISQASDHDPVCPGLAAEPEWCVSCGAELTDVGTCLNAHEEEAEA